MYNYLGNKARGKKLDDSFKMGVASYIRKTSGKKHDAESMNRAVEKMVAEALKCNSVVSILETDVEKRIFIPEFVV